MIINTKLRLSLFLAFANLTFSAEAITTEAWGYVWAQNATGNYTANNSYSRNSSGDIFGVGVNNTVTHLSTGRYRVRFPGLGNVPRGNVQVTAYGSGSNKCKVRSWSGSGANLDANVDCHTANGSLINTIFTVSYVRSSGTGGAGNAYVWANNSIADSYTPSQAYSYNSNGGTNTIVRTGNGQYTVTLPGQTASLATVQVTAYGSGSNYCKVRSWGQSGSSVRVRVRCHNVNGNLVNTQFSMNFARQYPNGGNSYSFLWANNQNAADFTPSLSYQRGYIGGDVGEVATDITAGRIAAGRYFAVLPGMWPTGSNVKVTAYGSDADYCKVVNWFGVAGGTRVSVNCFNSSGNPADSQFTLVYTGDLLLFL